MKITLLMQDTGSLYGAERTTLDLAAALKQSGDIEPHFLLIKEKRLGQSSPAICDALEAKSLPWRSFEVNGPFSFSLIRAIQAQLLQEGSELLQTVGYKANLHGGLSVGWGRRLPIIAVVHGWLYRQQMKERFYGWIDLQAMKRCSQVVVLSRHYQELLAKEGVPSAKVCRIPTGLEPSARQKEKLESTATGDTPFVVGIMGRLSEEKNHTMFLRAAKRLTQLTDKPVRFIVAGDGPDRTTLEQTSSSLGIEDLVTFAGFVDPNEWLKTLDVLVLCSSIENLPYCILEAMSASVPVVATKVGGVPDLVEDSKTGYLVSPDDDSELAQSLLCLLQDPEKKVQLGQGGYEKLVKEFTMEHMVKTYIELYRKLMNRGVENSP